MCPPSLCRRRQPPIMPERSGVRDARQVSPCGHAGQRDRAWDALEGLERRDDGREAPGCYLRALCVFPRLEACGLFGPRLERCLQNHGRRWGWQSTALSQRPWAGRPGVRPVERLSCRRQTAFRCHWAAGRSWRVWSRARRRSRIASAPPVRTSIGVRSLERLSRARCMASRRSVLTRAPAL